VPPVGTKAQVEDSGKEEAGEHNAQVETSGKEEAGDPAGDRQWMSLGEVLCDGDTVTLEVKFKTKSAQAVTGTGPDRFTIALKNGGMNPVIVKHCSRSVVFHVVPHAAWPPRPLSSKTEDISGKVASASVASLQCFASCGLLNGNNSPNSHVRRWALHVGKQAHGALASPVECLTADACPPAIRGMLSSTSSGSSRECVVSCARALWVQVFANSRPSSVGLVTVTCTGKQIDMKSGLLKGRWEFESGGPAEAVVVLVTGNCRVRGGGADLHLSSLKPTWGEGAMRLSGVARCEVGGGALVSQCLIHGRWWEFEEGRAQTIKSAKTTDGVVFVYTRVSTPCCSVTTTTRGGGAPPPPPQRDEK
jgi:hypothetical protein